MLFLFAILFSFTLISAGSLGRFTQDTTISLHQICDNCTFVNITSISFPNGSILIINREMNKSLNDYNFSFSDTSSPGLYIYNTCGDQDGPLVCENIEFDINKLGEELTTGRAIIYLILTFFIFLLFVFTLYINIILPSGNQKNSKGQITGIIRLKYVKIMLVPVTFALFNWFLNLLLSISNNLVDKFEIYNGMISWLFSVSISLSWPVFVVSLIWVIFVLLRDFKWNEQIKKWGKVLT